MDLYLLSKVSSDNIFLLRSYKSSDPLNYAELSHNLDYSLVTQTKPLDNVILVTTDSQTQSRILHIQRLPKCNILQLASCCNVDCEVCDTVYPVQLWQQLHMQVVHRLLLLHHCTVLCFDKYQSARGLILSDALEKVCRNICDNIAETL